MVSSSGKSRSLASGSDQSDRNRQALKMFLAPLVILPVDEAAVWAHGSLRAGTGAVARQRGVPALTPAKTLIFTAPRQQQRDLRCTQANLLCRS